MTLRRKMGFQIMLMIVGLLVVSFTAMWGLTALHDDYGLAVAGYQQLREVFQVGSDLTIARSLVSSEHFDRGRAELEVETAAAHFEIYLGEKDFHDLSPHLPHDTLADGAVKASLANALRQLRTPAELQGGGDVLEADSRAVNAAIGKISDLAAAIRRRIEAYQASAQRRHSVTTRAVATVSAAVVAAAIILGIMQYRGVMLPLGRLRVGVRRIAAGHFAERLVPRGGEEFVDLANEFNQMAGELDGFYHQLEEKVAQKSKELIRSERLASVGFLAAGVAHEINNPLGIISGYAEYSIEQLKARAAKETELSDKNNGDAELAKSLQIICDETFRCKDITGKLLSLARQGNETRAAVCLAEVANKVVSIVGGLREYRDRQLITMVPDGAVERRELTVAAVEAEMKQVVLNLTLNALEASPPERGQVKIEVARAGGYVELTVSDNGRGMSPQTLERAFEPFFTEKRDGVDAHGSRTHGTGLGLSISHAIIQNHGGSITATSDGPGKGSRFVVRLAAVES